MDNKEFTKEELTKIIYEAQSVNPLVWIYANKMKSERAIPISFKRHKYLIEPFCDMSPRQVYQKSAQMGLSIMMILKTFWMAKFRNMNIIYTLPTVEDVRKFVPSKVNPIVNNNSQIYKWVKDKDSIETKKVGDSFIFYKGTFTSKEAIMLSSDLNVYDEVDRSDLSTIDIYSSRVKFSPYHGEWFLSNPSAPTAGVGAKFTLSTQNHWFIKPSCGHYQYMDWDNNVDKANGRYICFRCGKKIENYDRTHGEWVAKYPSREMKGYWINQMMAEWIDVKNLILEEEDKNKAYFYNFVLGKPYMGSDTIIDASLILKNVVETPNSQTNCIMGVDQGLKKHYVLGNKEGIFQVGSTKEWDDIENLRNKFDAVLIMDALPDLTVPRQLREKYPHKVHLCYYHKDKDRAVDTKWGENKDWGYVWADRNRTLQTVIDWLASGKIKFQMKPYDLEEFVKHWSTMYKLVEEDFLGVPKFIWESTGKDHFCLVGETLIETSKGEILIKKVKVGDMVLTRKGYRKVLRSWMTRKNAKVMKVNFSNRKSLIGTPDHKIWIKDKGFVDLHSTNYGDIIETCKKQSYSKVLLIGGILILLIVLIGCILIQMVLNIIKVGKDFIRKFGCLFMENFQKVVQYTIKTVTRLTMIFPILNVSQEVSICPNMQKKVSKIHNGENKIKNILKKSINYHIYGEEHQKEKRGILNMLLIPLFLKFQKNSTVLNVINHLKQFLGQVENTVPPDVTIVSKQECGEEDMVYNLEVEDVHEYFANGALVSNCHATNYFLIGLKRYSEKRGSVVKNSFSSRLHGEPSFEIVDDTMPGKPIFEKEPKDWRYV
ncbi:MAG: Bacteriophage tail assembly protein [Candidatus Woesebacteria bacterium GW2011_GWB1_39_12]|uniref:Bacteriophage tail assembly protein n=1 Tax=Candidatus Woesebacteria bacterium GW2011_GWB1_39_12 TaxID=1618574 RepID=A0A0G0PPN9_9BACT|nr:MAG: Bacteriophage tail assembly protein [Candidatus Woesebacteria bacterium GW2011_GWB1_39_12]